MNAVTIQLSQMRQILTTIKYSTDIVPIVPGRFLGFQHPHGEVHILSPGHAVSCSGE